MTIQNRINHLEMLIETAKIEINSNYGMSIWNVNLFLESLCRWRQELSDLKHQLLRAKKLNRILL